MMDKIFITGGAGYVGSVLTPYLLNKGYHVTVLDLFMYGNTLFPHPNLKTIKGDIRDKALLEKNLNVTFSRFTVHANLRHGSPDLRT